MLPTTVDFLINARTAQAIGVNLPQALSLRPTTSSNEAMRLGASLGRE